jgi:hypothetical protein
VKKLKENGFHVPDGNTILKSDIPAIAELIARTARWVHPDTFRALPVWAPHAARGQPLFDAGWSRRYTNTRKATGITSEKFEGNVAAAYLKRVSAGSLPSSFSRQCHQEIRHFAVRLASALYRDAEEETTVIRMVDLDNAGRLREHILEIGK